MLVHDRHDGASELWSFTDGLKFIEAVEPVAEGIDVPDQKLLGPEGGPDGKRCCWQLRDERATYGGCIAR